MSSTAGAAVGSARLRTDVLLMLGSRALILLLGLAQSVVVARTLGPSGRGAVAVAVSLVNVFTQVGSLGLVTANTYFVARDRSTLGPVAVNSMWIGAVGGTALAGLLLLLKLIAPGAVSGLTWPELAATSAAMPGLLASLLLHAILLGEARTIAYNALAAVLQGVILIGVVAAVTVQHATVLGVLVALAAGYTVSAGAYYLALKGYQHGWRPHPSLVRAMLSYGLRVYIATVLAFIVIRIDVLFVNGYRGAHDAGLYAVAVAGVDALYLLPAIVGFNIFPRIARGAERSLTAAAFRTLLPLYGLLCLVSVPLAGPIVHLLYGQAFTPSIGLYYWIAPGAFCLGMVSVLSNHFAGEGFPLNIMAIWVISVCLNIALNVLFLRDGLFVAPLASTVAYGALLVMHSVAFAREIGGYRPLVPRWADLRALVSRRPAAAEAGGQ